MKIKNMKKKLIFPLFAYFLNLITKDLKTIRKEIKNIKIIDFDVSMKIGDKETKILKNDKFSCQLLNLFKKIFKQNNPSKIKPTKNPKIPKIIHQIWLGGDFPESYKFITHKWRVMHSNWEYKLWNDKNISELFPLQNQKFFDECKNLGEKADILRYEILYRYGGIYVDIDYECLHSFDFLNHLYEFYGGLEPISMSPLYIGNSLLASQVKHPILKECIESLKNYRHLKTIPQRTGPLHITRSFLKVGCLPNILIFPATYFYPMRLYHTLRNMDKFNNISPESLGIHYWSGTWKDKCKT